MVKHPGLAGAVLTPQHMPRVSLNWDKAGSTSGLPQGWDPLLGAGHFCLRLATAKAGREKEKALRPGACLMQNFSILAFLPSFGAGHICNGHAPQGTKSKGPRERGWVAVWRAGSTANRQPLPAAQHTPNTTGLGGTGQGSSQERALKAVM